MIEQETISAYAQRNNFIYDEAVNYLISYATPTQLDEWRDLSLEEKAWRVLQVQEDVDPVKITTKRFLFNTICDKVVPSTGLFGITGARYTGKTTLLRQVQQKYFDEAYYLDCSYIDDTFSFSDFYDKMRSVGKHLILLDDICEVDEYNYQELIDATRENSKSLCIIITGGVSALVNKLCTQAGYSNIYTLPPIMYIEKLSWDNGFNEINLDCIRKKTDDKTLRNYLRSQFILDDDLIEYMKTVVQGYVDSYHPDKEISLSVGNVINILRYLSLCQVIYRQYSPYVSLLEIESDLVQIINDGDYSRAKIKWDLSKQRIEEGMQFLKDNNLISETSVINTFTTDQLPLGNIVFEYPWICCCCFKPNKTDVDELLPLCLEYAVLQRLSYIYKDVIKYRTISSEDIDTIYIVNKKYGLAIYDTLAIGVGPIRERKLAEIMDRLELDYIVCGHIEVNAQLLASLELELYNIYCDGLLETEKTVVDVCQDNMNLDVDKEYNKFQAKLILFCNSMGFDRIRDYIETFKVKE